MRLVTLAAAASLVSPAFADREITVPRGQKLSDGLVRLEFLGVPGERTARAWLGTGFLRAFDAEWTLDRSADRDWASSFDFSYNYSPPIVDISPGVSVGVQDGANVSAAGRAFYLAVTYDYGNVGELNQDQPTKLTLGLWTRRTGAGFFGVNLPLSNQVFLVGEHNSERLAAGLELRPASGVRFKAVFERDGTELGFAISQRF